MSSLGQNLGLSPDIIEELRNTSARYPEVDELVIFGSRARDETRPGSDIDLAILGPKLDEGRFAELWNDLEELPIAFKMDIIHFDQLKDNNLKKQIRRDGVVIYRNSRDD